MIVLHVNTYRILNLAGLKFGVGDDVVRRGIIGCKGEINKQSDGASLGVFTTKVATRVVVRS